MGRAWCVVLDTVSSRSARRLGDALGNEGFDVEIKTREARVWCFAYEQPIDDLVASVDAALRRLGLGHLLQAEPHVRVWSESLSRYVDPAAPDEDPDGTAVWIPSDLEPDDVRWIVRLELTTPFELRSIRRRLPLLRRPVIGTGRRHIDIGVRHGPDADRVIGIARSFRGVAAARPRELRNGLRRTLILRRLAGAYVEGPDGPGYDHPDLGGADGAARYGADTRRS